MRIARSPFVRAALFSLIALACVWPILGDAGRANSFRDAEVLALYERAAIETIERFGELPLWNPYYCGGLDAVGAPQSRLASPGLLFGLLFGAERAEVILVFLLLVLGMEGSYRWLSLRGARAEAACVVAPLFALSGHFSVAFFRGWTGFFGFELVPWILFGVTLAARGRLAGVAIASVAFAAVLGFGGTFAAPLIALAVTAEAIRAILEARRGSRARAVLMLALTASFMATVSMFRLWPIAETLTATPRIMAGTPSHTPMALLHAVASKLDVKGADVPLDGSFFVGAGFLAVVALGGTNRRGAGALAIAVVFVWLSAGYGRNPPLFALLRELPIFSALRYPERFLWLAVLFASEAAAVAFSHVPFASGGTSWRFVTRAVLVAALAWSATKEVASFHRLARARHLVDVSVATSARTKPEEFHQTRGNRWLASHYVSLGLGSLSCWETHPVAQSPLLRADLQAEERLDDASRDAGTVARIAWSPNRISLRVEATRSVRVLVNQNWHPGWHASAGEVISHDGLLAVDLPAGARVLELTFRPWATLAGAGISSIAALSLAILAWRGRRRGGALLARRLATGTALAAALPWLALGVAYAASPDPRWPPPIAKNPDGSLAIAAGDERAVLEEAGATPIGARFDLPVRIEGGRVIRNDETRGVPTPSHIAVETFLRRTGHLPRETAMFVHVVRRKNEAPAAKDARTFYNLDHQVAAGSFYLSDAPEGALVRDVIGLHLERAAPGTWDVLVGFGAVGGRRGRSRVVDGGAAEVDDHRVRIATFTVE